LSKSSIVFEGRKIRRLWDDKKEVCRKFWQEAPLTSPSATEGQAAVTEAPAGSETPVATPELTE